MRPMTEPSQINDRSPSPAAEYAAVFVGGATGTLLRYGLVQVDALSGTQWPWATFVANVVGAFLLGLVVAIFANHADSVKRALLGTGLCGGLTTFSTFQLELYLMIDRGDVGLAIAYLATSILLGLLAFAAGRRRFDRFSHEDSELA
jgi:CrcB protein